MRPLPLVRRHPAPRTRAPGDASRLSTWGTAGGCRRAGRRLAAAAGLGLGAWAIGPLPLLAAALQEIPPLPAGVPTPPSAQEPPREIRPTAWNHPEAHALLALGRGARQRQAADTSLESYQALTEGHIYFYIDPEDGEQALIRVDQVAVELFWEAPDLVRQRIVGERSETRLPVRDFRYYLDRLTLVQYGFGDEIEVGQGLDVARVPHPLAPPPPGGPERDPYDVRVLDAVSLRLPGVDEPLQVVELQVRPRDPSLPGALGSVFLDVSDGQLVRLALTFTPASYVDPRTDRIRVELDYGLWEGRYWLPNRQEIEVRREIPEFDVGVGTVIRAVLRVGAYDLGAPMPTFLRGAAPVTQAPLAERGAWEFREGLFDAMDRDGVGRVTPRVDPRALRVEAARLLGNQPPSGLSPLRFHLPAVSSLVAADQARGVSTGLGGRLRLASGAQLRGWSGVAIGAGRPQARLEVEGPPRGETGPTRSLGWTAEWNAWPELGARPAAPGLFSTLGALAGGEDYRSPYRRSGAWVRSTFRWDGAAPAGTLLGGRPGSGSLGGWPGARGLTRVELRAGLERHRSATSAWERAPLGLWGEDFRPLPEVEAGTFANLGIRVRHREDGLGFGSWGGSPGAVLEVEGEGELLAGRPGAGLRVEAHGTLTRRPFNDRSELRVHLGGGTLTGDVFPQQERFLGGRGTVIGLPFHAQRGSLWFVGGIEGSQELGTPWLRLRGGLEAGWVDDSFLAGARMGLGLGWDVLRLDVGHGLAGPGGRWQVLVSIDPRWWEFL